MKTLLIALVVCMSYVSATAQEIDPRIKEVYKDKTQELVGNDPDRLKALNDLLQNRIKIETSPNLIGDKYPKLSSVDLLNKYNPDLKKDVVFDPNNFNP